MIMETIQKKEEKAILDLVKSLQITVNSLGMSIGELKEDIAALPSDYVKSSEVGAIMKEYFHQARIYSSTVTANIPEEQLDEISSLKAEFGQLKTDITESLGEIKKRQPLLMIKVGSKPLLWTLATLILAISVSVFAFLNSPMYLAHQEYILSSYGDVRNPGVYYHDAYSKVKAGKRKEVTARIKAQEIIVASYKEAESSLTPFVGEDIYVTKIQYGQKADTLVDFRHTGNDIYWSAYFLDDGSIWITDSDNIVYPTDAEKMLTSKKVKWEKVR